MVTLNKVIGFLMSPLTVGLALMTIALVCQYCRLHRKAFLVALLSIVWFWAWSTESVYQTLGGGLEQAYPPVRAECQPAADVIVILGGGMGANTNLPYAEMSMSADRVWHAARLYHAGKARMIVPSGGNEERATLPLLLDLGVPRQAICLESQARNTEENALLVERLLQELPTTPTNRPTRILLVTSAWHMRRALLNFERTGLEVSPATTDHEGMAFLDRKDASLGWYPTLDMFYRNGLMWKEHLGYWLYRVKYAVVSSGT